MEAPVVAVAIVGTLMTGVIAVFGYLLRNAYEGLRAETKTAVEKIESLDKKVTRLEVSIATGNAEMETRFAQAELRQTQQFLDKETATRDYIGMTTRIDGLHKRVDKIERESNTR